MRFSVGEILKIKKPWEFSLKKNSKKLFLSSIALLMLLELFWIFWGLLCLQSIISLNYEIKISIKVKNPPVTNKLYLCSLAFFLSKNLCGKNVYELLLVSTNKKIFFGLLGPCLLELFSISNDFSSVFGFFPKTTFSQMMLHERELRKNSNTSI